MSKVEMPGICNCVCHSHDGVIHGVPCCEPCAYCGQNVLYPNRHVQTCEAAKADTRRQSIDKVYRNNLEEILTLDEYQTFANNMSGYEFDTISESSKASHELVFNLIGLCGEAGEVAEKIKKAIRRSNMDDVSSSLSDSYKNSIALELGDTFYYLARVANLLGLKLSEVARLNQEKLLDRLKRDVVKGEGDNR